MMTVIRLLLLASLCSAAPFNLTLDKPEINNEDMEVDIVVNDNVDHGVHYHQRNTTGLNTNREGKFTFQFRDVGGDISFGTMITNNGAPISGDSGWSGEAEEEVNSVAEMEDEVEDFYKEFLARYPTGKIVMSEFMKMTKEYFEKMTGQTSDCESFCNNVFKACDTDGAMSFREVVQAINIGKVDASEKEKIMFAFRLCDINKDRVIDKEELYDCVMGLMKAMGEKDLEGMEEGIDEMMAEIDTNKDGEVTKEEFFSVSNKDKTNGLCQLPDMIGHMLQEDLLKPQ